MFNMKTAMDASLGDSSLSDDATPKFYVSVVAALSVYKIKHLFYPTAIYPTFFRIRLAIPLTNA